jgi:hypothetical protein
MRRAPESQRRLIARIAATVALAVLLLAATAQAEPPCKNPRTLPCQRVCAVYSAKTQLTLSAQDPSIPQDKETARQAARFAGYTLQEVDAMTQRQIVVALYEYCRD